MKALVPAAIIFVTAVTVVIGANVVMGDGGSDASPEFVDAPTAIAGDQFIHGYDSECVDRYGGDEGPGFIPLECLRIPGQPDRTPVGWKLVECPPDLLEADPEICEWEGESYVPDFGPNLPTIVINGKTVTLPDGVVLGSYVAGGRTTIQTVDGASWVKFSADGVHVDSEIRPGDREKLQPILDALNDE